MTLNRMVPILFLFISNALAISGCSCSDHSDKFGRDLAEIEEIVSRGTFAGAANHNAAGDVEIIRTKITYYLRFASNFTVDDGPELYVYLGKNGRYSPSTLISVLGANSGPRYYEIPSSIDIANYSEVWIWSRLQEQAYASAY